MVIMDKILIVDSDEEVRSMLVNLLHRYNYNTLEAVDEQEALSLLREDGLLAVILDIKLSDSNEFAVLRQMKDINVSLPVIMVTDLGDIQKAIASIKLGAYDYIVKPVKTDRLMIILKRAIEKLKIEGSFSELALAFDSQFAHNFGKSAAIHYVVEQIMPVAASDFMVIIQGEVGSGKNFLARVLHYMSKRARGPFISVDMSSIPDSLVESEMFGFEKGTFAGDGVREKGLLELANGGTMLIDELQNMSLFVQERLLNAVNEKMFFPPGSDCPVSVDVRIISCVNTDIRKAVHENKFREDLYFSLGEFIFFLPPLRERREDISVLARNFFEEFAEELNKPVRKISDEAMNIILRYDWPGNVRELRNTIRRAVSVSIDGIIRSDDVDLNNDKQAEAFFEQPQLSLKEMSAIAVRNTEVKAIRQVLIHTKGNKTLAARLLRIDYKTLLTKIRDYNITE
jgi:DNA-binding NtrC family response regulator